MRRSPSPSSATMRPSSVRSRTSCGTPSSTGRRADGSRLRPKLPTASRGSGPTPPPKPLADALHDSLAGPEPGGVTARITFTNKLFPSGALTGQVGSALMSGASGRLWATNDGRGRLELQSDAGDVQVVWNKTSVFVYDASSNTLYRATLPTRSDTSSEQPAVPSVAKISDLLTKLGEHVSLSG